MTDYHRDFIYCSPLLPVASLDLALVENAGSIITFDDPAPSPELALMMKRDGERLRAWLKQLKPSLAIVGDYLLEGMTQAAIAKLLKVSEAAVSKRITRIVALARLQLRDLRYTPLIN